MRLPGWLIAVFEAEYFVLTAGFLVFTIGYAWLTRGAWRRSAAGKILISLGASCSVILSLSILRIFLPEQPWRIYATAIALAGLVGVVIWLNVLMFTRQRKTRRAWRTDQERRESERLRP